MTWLCARSCRRGAAVVHATVARPMPSTSARSWPAAGLGRARKRRVAAPAAPKNPFVELLLTVKPAVDARLRRFFDDRRPLLARHGREVRAIFESLERFCLSGGKRVRPALVAAGYRLA